MNEQALDALTTTTPNNRQSWLLAIARLCRAQWPTMGHATRERVMMCIIMVQADKPENWHEKSFQSPKGIGTFVNDVVDIWQSIIDDPSLLR